MLILDEPTNHLDIETREALVEALADYSGAVILVSHDWHLVELVADRLWLVADGTVRPFDGDLEEYRHLLLAPERDAAAKEDGGGARRASRREAAERRVALEPLRRRSRRAEEAAQLLAAEQSALDRRLASQGLEGAALVEAYRRRAELSRLIAEAEAEWLAAEEAIETAMAAG